MKILQILIALLNTMHFDALNSMKLSKPGNGMRLYMLDDLKVDSNSNSIPIRVIPPEVKAFLSASLFLSLPCLAIDGSLPISYEDVGFYSKYFLAGGICASFSHGISVPLDVVKTKKQISKEMAKLTISEAFKKIIADDGFSMLFKGMVPTLVGYSIQGAFKYGLYEIFKRILTANISSDQLNQIVIYMIAGACAELIASTFLSPFEACRIRTVANPNYADGILPCLKKLIDTEGIESLYRGLPAILVKQIPFTVVQLSTFETLKGIFFSQLNVYSMEGEYRWAVTLLSAMIAAVLASIVSQPGDTLLSAVNKQSRIEVCLTEDDFKLRDRDVVVCEKVGAIQIMKENIAELGVSGLFTGTKARLAHVGVIVVVQLLVYDYVKQLCGIPITGIH